MEECKIEELLHEVNLYRQAIREAQETLAAAEREIDAYLSAQHRNAREAKVQEERVYTPSGVWYDYNTDAITTQMGTGLSQLTDMQITTAFPRGKRPSLSNQNGMDEGGIFMASSFLNEDALRELIRRVTTGIDPQCADDLEALNDVVSSFHAYADTVVRGETKMALYGHGVEGQPYRDMVSQYDQNRHGCHEAAIINVRVLNRLASLYELDPVFTGDDTQRHQVADFCLELDQYFFRNRRMKLS